MVVQPGNGLFDSTTSAKFLMVFFFWLGALFIQLFRTNFFDVFIFYASYYCSLSVKQSIWLFCMRLHLNFSALFT